MSEPVNLSVPWGKGEPMLIAALQFVIEQYGYASGGHVDEEIFRAVCWLDTKYGKGGPR